jgi:hypothetical protein
MDDLPDGILSHSQWGGILLIALTDREPAWGSIHDVVP